MKAQIGKIMLEGVHDRKRLGEEKLRKAACVTIPGVDGSNGSLAY